MKICKGQLFAIMATVILLISACKGGNESNYPMSFDSVRADNKSTVSNDKVFNDESKAAVSSKAAEAKANDSIIRTADLKFKVKQVYKATTAIEDIATQVGGFVTSSNLTSNIDQENNTEISADSSLVTTLYTVTNNMVLRVPNTALDTTLKSMAYLIDYLDYRNIKADDSRLLFLQSQLRRNRLQNHSKRVENNIETKGKKLVETNSAEEDILNTQEKADNALLESYSLKDKVNFSTITLTIYQSQGIKRDVITNTKNIEPYKPSIIKRMADSIKTGWIVMEDLLLFLVSIWSFIMLAFIGYIIYRKYFKKIKN